MLAYTIRFLAASLGAVEAGLSKISRNIDAAARTLGASMSETLFRVHLPLLRPALGAAALLVFVDSMKELPATLLLRPFNFDTLSTHVFTLVSLYRYEEAGLSALTIVAVSLAPVLFCCTGSSSAAAPGPLQAANGVRNAPRIGVAHLLITQENAGVGLAMSDNRARKAVLRCCDWRSLDGWRWERVDRVGMKPRQLPWKWLLLGLIAFCSPGHRLVAPENRLPRPSSAIV